MSLVEYARRKKLYDPIAHALASTLNYEKSHFDKLVASAAADGKLTTGRTASLLSPELDDPTDWRPVFDWTSVIHLGGIVYVGLDALSDYEVARRWATRCSPTSPAWPAASTSSAPVADCRAR